MGTPLTMGDKLKLTGALLIMIAGLGLASTIEIGSSDFGQNEPWCGS
jgi:hypothetical protein